MHPRNLQPVPGQSLGTDLVQMSFLVPVLIITEQSNKVSRCTMTLTRRKKREYNNFSYSLMFSKSCSTGLSNFSMILREKTVQEQGNGSSAEPSWKTARQQGEALLSSASKPQFPPGKKDKARRSFPDTSCSNLQVTRPVCFQLCLEKGK